MSEIIRPDGHVLTSVKRAHDPERVMNRRVMISKELADCVNGFAEDMKADPNGATQPNEAAIFDHYNERWRAHCLIVQKSSEPVDVDPEAFANNINAQRAQFERAKLSGKPLRQLTEAELHSFDLLWVASTEVGELHMSNRFAVLIDDNGACYLHLPSIARGDDWPMALVQELRSGVLDFQLKRNGLSCASIANIVQAMGLKQWAKPSLKQLALAHQCYPVRRWWKPNTW